MSRNSHPSATENKARHCLKMGGGLQNQKGDIIWFGQYDAVHLKAISENYSLSEMLIIFIKGCRGVIFLRPKMGVAPKTWHHKNANTAIYQYKVHIIRKVSSCSFNYAEIYGPNQNIQWAFELLWTENQQNLGGGGWLTVLCSQMRQVFIRLTCREVLWYGASIRLSVCGSVHRACKHDTDWTVPARTVKLGTHTTYNEDKPYWFSRSGVKGQGHTLDIVKPCKRDTDWTVPARTVKLGTHTTYDKRKNPIDFQGQGSKVRVTR